MCAFRSQNSLPLGLDYCGMPSIEFLDIQEWKDQIRSVLAVELEEDVLSDMKIEWDRINLGIPIEFCGPCNIYNVLSDRKGCYDLYNLDFYGGFLHTRSKRAPKCIEALRAMIARQGAAGQSFILICTFNVRDTGVPDYLKFIDEIPLALAGWRQVEECCKAHRRSQATRLKLCFPFFCWQIGMSNGFSVQFADTVVYESSVTMLHFYCEFTYRSDALPKLTSNETLAEIASRPLIRLNGMIPAIDLAPPTIDPPV